MDIDALLEAFQDFEKKGKRETCPVLEQFLCHVAKTGQPMILWSQFKTYFMFKLEKVMDDFHASTPEQRGLHNPNVEYVPFEEMKKRILKIVDGYNGIPFTIQRLCELLTDPKRNYTGTDKFLRGLEKNVMVVSCVYPSSEKNGASSVNRMNGVMFPGNSSLYSDRNVNGPGTPKPLTRPKLSLSTSLSTNGLPDSPISREPEPTTEEVKEHCISESSLSESAVIPNSGIKNKHPEEEEDSDADKQEVKRLKFDEKEEEEEEETSEEKESSCHQGSESLSETPESSKDSCGEEYKSGTSCEQPGISDDHDPSSTQTEPSEGEGNSSEAEAAHSPKDDSAVDQSEQPASSEKSTSFEQDSGENSSSSSSSSDGEGLTSDKQVPSSSNSPDLSTEGGADISNGAETVEPEEQD
ncbi:serine/threonine-protein phosphatase 4 regulatory subunit 2-A-like isoform X2 [Acanthochromis polyacanthus]|uniref:serine/threonine-protein phosphatase 4 regulatory subunit 2-A-like isoform X2 n=1 Tax=Acanthochromis polyacanthus TaxID=80966 RepID=UPI000B8F9487|nr:serine/threonine-protein phosphatase 4 regulatory subunit 2-A-like isoform X2 [Acanthochromis polyacanthus]